MTAPDTRQTKTALAHPGAFSGPLWGTAQLAVLVITLALMGRIGSRDEVEFSHRVLSAMRGKFGGHAVKKEG